MTQVGASPPSNVVVPVRDDYSESGTIARGAQFLKVLGDIGVDVAGRSVVDLGAGFGSVSLAAARQASSVTAVDIHPERLAAISQRAESEGVHVDTLEANLLDEHVDVSGQIGIMVGVVEYAGLWSSAADVRALQVSVLKSARSAIDDDGTFVLATKNRVWPKSVLKEVHTGVPLVAALPRRMATTVNKKLTGDPYRHWIHGPAGWRKLLERAGFSRIETYVPYLGYQYPVLLSQNPTRADFGRLRESSVVDGLERDAMLGRTWKAKVGLTVAAARLGVEMSQGIVFVARP